MTMEIQVTTNIHALHSWPEAHGARDYLRNAHHHNFQITAWATVSHEDRDIEFHDLRQKLEEALTKGASYKPWRTSPGDSDDYIHDFGRASCEDIGNHVLKHMPEVHKVRVMEDSAHGACVYREEENPERPYVVTLCGSTKFKQAWIDAIEALELMGYAVFSVGSFMHHDNIPISPEVKESLDRLHKNKIAMSDAIYVLNVDGYIGSSTRSEIEYAKSLRKRVMYLCPEESTADDKESDINASQKDSD